MAGRGPSLRPVVWFVFNAAEEVRAAVELTRDPCLHYSVRWEPLASATATLDCIFSSHLIASHLLC